MNSTELQSAADVLMIRPVRFAGNPQTSESNRFQDRAAGDFGPTRCRRGAARVRRLVGEACAPPASTCTSSTTRREPHTPDSIFPNNWVSFHADGTVVLYPMLAENRRQERRPDLLEALSSQARAFASRACSTSRITNSGGKFLEGTGSLVLDRAHRIAYACVSPRTDLDVLGDFAQQLDYDIVAFEALDATGAPIYHTNVLMCVGARFAAICSECIREDERGAVLDALRTTGHEIVDLSMEQLAAVRRQHARAALRLRRARVVAMSARALDSLTRAAAHDPAKLRRADRRRADSHDRDARRRQRALHAGGDSSAEEALKASPRHRHFALEFRRCSNSASRRCSPICSAR